MAKSTSHPWVLVAAVAIMALALSAVGPVLAHPGASGTNSQGGTSIALQSGDTLGTVVSRYNLSGSDLRNFFTQNTGLVLQPGQTITFPAGVTVNMGGAAGQVTETATAAAGGLATATSPAGGVVTETATAAAGGVATETPAAGGVATETATVAAGGVATETPVAGGVATEAATAAAGVATEAATAAAGVGAAQVTGTPAGTMAAETPTAMATVGVETPTAIATVAAETPTAVATVAAETPTTAATAATTPTTAAGGGGTGTSQTYTTVQGDTLGKIIGFMGFPVSGAAGGATAPTDAQLEEFVTLNSDLQFESGQTAMLPAGIPQTGQGNLTGTPAAGVTGTPGANQGTYTVQAGDTLQDIASKYGITVQQLLQMNPNLLQPGMTINVPGGTGTPGAIPQTGNQAERTFNVQNQETLSSLILRYGLGTNDMVAFFSANCDVAVLPGQTVRFPIPINQSGNAQGDNFTYQTKDGDTLCSVVNMMGLSLPQGATAAATATPAAGAVGTATPATGAVETATPAAGAVETATPAAGAVETATPAAGAAETATPAAGVVETATPAAGVTGTATPAAGGVATETPAAGGVVTETATAAAGGVGAVQVTGTPAATMAAETPTAMATVAAETPTAVATVAAETPTTAATMAAETPTAMATVATTPTTAAGAVETATPAAGAVETATPAAGAVETATPAATGGGNMGAYTNNPNALLREFVKYNPNLKLENGSTITVPAGIPQTGGVSQGAVAAGQAAGQAQGQAARFVNQQGCPSAPAGSGFYISRGGESFQSIADKFGVTVQEVMDRNPGVLSVSRGQVVMLPGVEAPGKWNLQLCNLGGPTALPSR